MEAADLSLSSDDPYPPDYRFRVVDVRYIDHLQIVRYNALPKTAPRDSEWQLTKEYDLEVVIETRDDKGSFERGTLRIQAPAAMHTDLASVPRIGRWIVSVAGPHLEASIIHDYLFMKWTDHRLKVDREGRPSGARFSDFVFANAVLKEGMKRLTNFSRFQRFIVNFAVGIFGWWVFKNKKKKFSELLPIWELHLSHLASGPLEKSDAAVEHTLSIGAKIYIWIAFVIFIIVLLLGVWKLSAWLGLTGWLASIAAMANAIGTSIVWILSFFGLSIGVCLVAYALLHAWILVKRNM